MGLTEESHCDELVNDKFAEVFQFKDVLLPFNLVSEKYSISKSDFA